MVEVEFEVLVGSSWSVSFVLVATQVCTVFLMCCDVMCLVPDLVIFHPGEAGRGVGDVNGKRCIAYASTRSTSTILGCSAGILY